MVAFLTSSLIGILGLVVVVWYGSTRREPGAPLTWGQAYGAAMFVFFMLFWWYGVIPHQWLTWADNELNWRPDALLAGPGSGTLENVVPFTLNKLHIRDLVAVGIYGVGLGGQIAIWAWWNDRKKKADARAAIQPTSSYGRPLVKKG